MYRTSKFKILKSARKIIFLCVEYGQRAPSIVGPIFQGEKPHDATASFIFFAHNALEQRQAWRCAQ